MWKAIGVLVLLACATHFYMLARTGQLDPCDAAYARLEYDALGTFKNSKRWIAPEDAERTKLCDSISRREIAQCYKIALF
jgi:hypothetical protein